MYSGDGKLRDGGELNGIASNGTFRRRLMSMDDLAKNMVDEPNFFF